MKLLMSSWPYDFLFQFFKSLLQLLQPPMRREKIRTRKDNYYKYLKNYLV
jgi:hypothetical protein